mmetsp:Transcript_29485/g.49580  ORF Transcript_29485/g.49580 Transcript_29485/m.49580 type:complete len:325 (+) Transcript_29485:395-1369(+)
MHLLLPAEVLRLRLHPPPLLLVGLDLLLGGLELPEDLLVLLDLHGGLVHQLHTFGHVLGGAVQGVQPLTQLAAFLLRIRRRRAVAIHLIGEIGQHPLQALGGLHNLRAQQLLLLVRLFEAHLGAGSLLRQVVAFSLERLHLRLQLRLRRHQRLHRRLQLNRLPLQLSHLRHLGRPLIAQLLQSRGQLRILLLELRPLLRRRLGRLSQLLVSANLFLAKLGKVDNSAQCPSHCLRVRLVQVREREVVHARGSGEVDERPRKGQGRHRLIVQLRELERIDCTECRLLELLPRDPNEELHERFVHLLHGLVRGLQEVLLCELDVQLR